MPFRHWQARNGRHLWRAIDFLQASGRSVLQHLLPDGLAFPDSDGVGMLGGFLIAYFTLRLTPSQYWMPAYQILQYNDLVQGLIKPFVFAFVISLVGCYYGMNTTGGTQGVGRATTQAVVVASVWIFVLTYFIGRIFVHMG